MNERELGMIAAAINKIASALTPAAMTQNVVTGSRAIGTVYQNTTGKPMYVNAAVQSTTTGTNVLGITDASATPATDVFYKLAVANPENITVTMLVLPGNYYKVTGAATVIAWTEWY